MDCVAGGRAGRTLGMAAFRAFGIILVGERHRVHILIAWHFSSVVSGYTEGLTVKYRVVAVELCTRFQVARCCIKHLGFSSGYLLAI